MLYPPTVEGRKVMETEACWLHLSTGKLLPGKLTCSSTVVLLCSWEWSPHGPVTSSRTCLSLLCWVLNCQCWKTRSDKSSNSWLAWSPAEHFSCCVYLAVPFTLLNLVHKCAGCFLTWILSLLSGHVMYVVNITTSVSPHHSLDGHGVYLFLLLLEIKAF